MKMNYWLEKFEEETTEGVGPKKLQVVRKIQNRKAEFRFFPYVPVFRAQISFWHVVLENRKKR